MAFPQVEVRFQDLSVDAKVMVGARGEPFDATPRQEQHESPQELH